MADRAFGAESIFPSFTGRESAEETIEEILDCLYRLDEQYKYVLSRLEERDE